MKQTRKWPVVQAEAKRLAGMRLSPREIARRLGLSKSTVTRWMQDGRLERKPRGPAVVKAAITATLVEQTPAVWAASVRRERILDATGAQLVTLAEAAMAMAQDPTAKPQIRLAATARFQSLVTQLALVEKTDAQPAPVEKKRHTNPPIRRVAGDPRAFLEQLK